MSIENLINSGSTPMLEAALAFTSARQRMLAENIANIDTPGYRAKQLDPAAFQKVLREAAQRRGNDPAAPLRIRNTREFRMDASGRLEMTPTRTPPENLLFHDGSNARIEKQMSALAENAMAHQLFVELLKGNFDGMMKAIRGRAG